MLKNKTDILPFLILLIFVEKIGIADTRLIKLLWLSIFHLILEVWRSISNKILIIKIIPRDGVLSNLISIISAVKLWLCLILITCLISNIWRSKSSNNLSIQKTLSNNFLKYLAEWNATKMKYHGKDEMKYNVYFLSKIMAIYLFLFSGPVRSKLIYHGKVLLRNLIFYIVYVSGSEMSDIDRRRYGCGG